jgi:predicted secreted hydrolase
MDRRTLLASIAGSPLAGIALAPAQAQAQVQTPATLRFPVDFGAHPETRTEWWYITGSLNAGARLWGFQVTFFRSATGIAQAGTSRFDAAQLIFAHAAVTDLEHGRLRHDQRIARSGFRIAQASSDDTEIALRDWQLARAPLPGDAARSRYTTRAVSDAAGFAFELQFDTTQPVLLQGEAGLSRKGPEAAHTSRYYSEPQLAVQGTLALDGARVPVQGRAWLDHEWSDAYLAPQAAGWDWIGMNLDDGGALMAFRIRRTDGTTLYAGGSFRAAGGPVQNFAAAAVRFTPGRVWESAASKARYPVQWRIETPAGRFDVNALLDNQELDSRGSTGAIYWEGLSDLIDERGARVGRGYLEMTGYAAALRM